MIDTDSIKKNYSQKDSDSLLRIAKEHHILRKDVIPVLINELRERGESKIASEIESFYPVEVNRPKENQNEPIKKEEQLTKLQKTIGVIISSLIISCFIWIMISKPLNIVGENPMLLGFIGTVLTVCSVIFCVYALSDDKLVTIAGIGGVVIFIGGFLSGWNLEKSKVEHLIKYGQVVEATITDKKVRSFVKNLKRKEIFEIYYTFKTSENIIVNEWESVSKDEFDISSEKLLVIYSPLMNNVSDLIITNNERTKYIEKIRK